ncbi:MAG: LOG family protein [Planctomycetaceae bacterium]|nr:LOG family protein [Planctomycetaceae bacterium]
MSKDNIRIPFDENFERPAILTDQQEENADNNNDNIQTLLNSPSYSLAFLDHNFMRSDYARSIRLQLEMEKPEWFMRQYGIRSTVIVFGSARFISQKKAARLLAEAEERLASQPDNTELRNAVKTATLHLETSVYYEQAREFARIVSEENTKQSPTENESVSPFDYVICTGGGPGIMEAANRGANEVGAPTIGLNIKLPYEQRPNPYVSPQLCFQFHYFNVRKLHFMLRAKALVACPGGFGTFDELFEALTLRQTERMQQIPIILIGVDFWKSCINFDYLVKTGVINRADLELFHLTDSPQEAWNTIKAFYRS